MINLKKTLALCLFIKLAAIAPIFASYYPAVEELQEGFHHAKKENNYHLYMSRISEGTLSFWQEYWTKQDDWFNSEKWMTDSQRNLVCDRNNNIRKSSFFGGMMGFSVSKHDFESDSWVAFISPRDIRTFDELTHQDIEMAMTTKTSFEEYTAPMSTHMGISRSFFYSAKSTQFREYEGLFANAFKYRINKKKLRIEYEEYDIFTESGEAKYPFHRNASADLHSFGAKFMLNRHPDLLYMITVPLQVMRQKMKDMLPRATFIGDSLREFDGKEYRSDEYDEKNSPIMREKFGSKSITHIKDSNGDVVWIHNRLDGSVTTPTNIYTKEEASQYYNWFVSGGVPLTLLSQPFMTVGLVPLARLKPLEGYNYGSLPIDLPNPKSRSITLLPQHYSSIDDNFISLLTSNNYLTEITIHKPDNCFIDKDFFSYLDVMRKGLQNKPLLEKFHHRGFMGIDVSYFLTNGSRVRSRDLLMSGVYLGDTELLYRCAPQTKIFSILKEFSCEGFTGGEVQSRLFEQFLRERPNFESLKIN